MRLRDKVAIITGGGRGIGQAIALAYAREGAQVIVNDIDADTAQATAATATGLGAKAIAVPGDVAKAADIARLIDTAVRERGRVDVVVNNAMRIVPGKLEALPALAVFLASDEARYTTGSLVGCDGGQAIGYYLSVPGRRFSGGRID